MPKLATEASLRLQRTTGIKEQGISHQPLASEVHSKGTYINRSLLNAEGAWLRSPGITRGFT
eukprot:15455201-Alexandrium_andersonii.AAC.1